MHKDEAHACLWSRSLLSGNQGFSETSDEYGWWFRYLDLYGTRKTLGNTRISTRGNAPRAMTVRCIHGPAVPDGWDIPDPGTNRKRVIVRNAPTDGLWCHFEGGDITYIEDGVQKTAWPKMYSFGPESVYYDVPANLSRITFSHNNRNIEIDISTTIDWTYVNDSTYRPT